MSRSLIGSISPSVCNILSLVKALTTWYSPSTPWICPKNSFPNPKPSDAPLTSPAISVILKTEGLTDLGLKILTR